MLHMRTRHSIQLIPLTLSSHNKRIGRVGQIETEQRYDHLDALERQEQRLQTTPAELFSDAAFNNIYTASHRDEE